MSLNSDSEMQIDIAEVVTKTSCHQSNNLLSSLMKLRCDDIFCDVTIKCRDFEMRAHKNVLASATEYFKAMFLNETKEAKSGIVYFLKMSPEVVKQCIEFIYSGKVDISVTTAKDLLDASEMLQIPELSQLCAEFLAERVDMKTCGEILSLSILYSSEILNESIEAFLAREFEEYKETEDFKNLEFEAVSKCIEYLEDGGGSGEIRIWNAILTWVNQDLEDRRDHFSDLFEKVNLFALSKTFLKENILHQPLVKSSNECLTKLFKLITEEKCTVITARRKPLRKIFSLNSQVIIEHDLKTGKSKSIGRVPGKFSKYFNAISYRGCIYVGDGVGMYQYQLSDSVWSERLMANNGTRECRSLKCQYCGTCYQHSCAVTTDCYNRCIGVGGNMCMVTTTSLYMYNVSESKFSRFELNAELVERFYITASNDKIYVMWHNKAIEIDIATKACSHLSDMPSSRHSGAATWFNGKIYTFNTSWCGLEIYCYNPDSDHWTVVPGVEFCSKIDSIYIGDKLYLIRGDEKEPFHTIDLQKLKIPDEVTFKGQCFAETF